ncbi:uncharacterized protein BDZ99DRAFT_479008 [Mytilinidion resinicola]|uniref:Uncharacterized protein n=1 Tax=Mytilinidion resinicola TaxID=574789 RepID=A0A6A6YG59_9PEZI|nr:uncharacterized protein BDZ99DRAFT_479008 [Mytilinidion resinicola]KAF2807558.1 hypothetical protein BDZ99DRAFT_479008 [Mytilinidion resinicola]
MAPGGFTLAVLKRHPKATVRGITLPPEIGGLEVTLPSWRRNEKVHIEFLDVTMLADEMGAPAISIPVTHADLANFSSHRPFLGKEFDLVFCGAAVLRTHSRAAYRESQAWNNVELINAFTRFSNVYLFKPKQKHATRSSFYLVATKKGQWEIATFGTDDALKACLYASEDCVLTDFGS